MDPMRVNERIHPHKMPLDRRKSASTTGDGDLGDTCRICRGEGTIEQPLFYPCKCSGSIKFVHQDCLMEWLSHSQKKYCELCKTSFRFTKLYDKSMPATLPLPLFLRQVGVHIFKTFGRWSRYVLVTFIWTSWLPWSIRQIWRGLFWLADGSWLTPQQDSLLSSNTPSNASSLDGIRSDTQQAPFASYFDPVGEFLNLLTGAPLLRGLLRLITPKSGSLHMSTVGAPSLHPSSFSRQPSLLSNVSSLNALTNYPIINNGLIDILEGQLICLSVIAAFILVFLIREWVINQQPIMNMPNQDRADAQPAAAPVNEDVRQPGRRRRRGLRRLPERDGQPGEDDGDMDVARGPMAFPRPRRAVTDENLATSTTSPDALQAATLPARSASLTYDRTSEPDESEIDIYLARYGRPQTWSDVGLESPPLQRGMLDEVVDIRRTIEERVIHTSEHSVGEFHDTLDNVGQSSPANAEDSPTHIASSPAHGDADGVQRTDFVFSQSTNEWQPDNAADGNATLPPLLETANDNSSDTSDRHLETEIAESVDPVNSWETIDADSDSQNDLVAIGMSLSDSTEPVNEQFNDNQELIEVLAQEVSSSSSSETAKPDDETAADNLLDRVVQWMWHTDEQAEVPNQNLEQRNGDHANREHGGAHILPAANANPINPPPPPVNVPAHEPNIQFGVDLNDPNALDDAEDLEGILELIGMEGPLAGMVQNIIFSVFLITLTLSASVWCPYIWGKIAILVMSNPIGVFVKAPLFFISKCGNILIDLLLLFGGLIGYGLSNFAKLVRVVVAPGLPTVAAKIRVATVETWAYNISQNSGVRLEKAFTGTIFGLRPDLPTFSMQSHHALRVFRRALVDAFSTVTMDISGIFDHASATLRSRGVLGIPIFIGKEVFAFPGALATATKQVAKWSHVVIDDLRMRPVSATPGQDLSLVEWTTEDKVLATLVGYAFFAAAGFVYLKAAHLFLGLKKDEKVDGVFADSLRQAGGVLKVIIIIGIEMIAFPLYCGMLLDYALLPLFKDATIQSRVAFLMNAPVTCLFIHWFIGTCYMFHFALFVSMCRKIMRKGVLYFIRDPDDPTFHPVRDVLERPVATQLGKIAFSALVYGGLVVVCLGGVVSAVSNTSGILPIRWSTNEPRLAFPVDIIFYNFMLPFILRRAELSKRISNMYEWWFRQCARRLRLSHFLFGEQLEDEKLESQPFWHSHSAIQAGNTATEDETRSGEQIDSSLQRKNDGRYVRVPAADSVRIPKGTKVFVEVNEENERIDGVPDRDTGMHGRKDDRFMKVYVPPYFRARISGFIFLVWLFAASTGITFTVLPLLTGRYLIRSIAASKSAPNDLYAFTAGMHFLGALAVSAYMVVSRRDMLRSKVSSFLSNTREALPRIYQIMKHLLGLLYLFTTVFIILPFTASLLTELYIHMPIYSYFANNFSTRSANQPSSSTGSATSISPTIFILQTWTLGLLYLRLALRLAINYPNGQSRPAIAIRAIVRNGYLNPDVRLASRALILPALALCISLLAAPLGLARMVITLTGTAAPQDKLQIYRYSYPVLLGMVVSAYTAVGLQHKIEGWRVKIRDEVYLVGERLHNFSEPEGSKKLKPVKVSEKVIGTGEPAR